MERDGPEPVLRRQRRASLRVMREIERKIAIVTGGGSGIGRAIALRFARAGGRVAVLDVAEPAARDVAREIEACGGAATAVLCGVSRQDHGGHAIREVAQRVASVDLLINRSVDV